MPVTGYARDGDAKGFLAFGVTVAGPFFPVAGQGRSHLYLPGLLAPEVSYVTGRYFVKCKPRQPWRHLGRSTPTRRVACGPWSEELTRTGHRTGGLSGAGADHRRGHSPYPGGGQGARPPGATRSWPRPLDVAALGGLPTVLNLPLDVSDDVSGAGCRRGVPASSTPSSTTPGWPATARSKSFPPRRSPRSSTSTWSVHCGWSRRWRPPGESGERVRRQHLLGAGKSAPRSRATAGVEHVVEAMSETLYFELGHFGIRVVIVEPGYIVPGMKAGEDHRGPGVYDDLYTQWAGTADAVTGPEGRPGPDVVAEAVAAAIEDPASPVRVLVGGPRRRHGPRPAPSAERRGVPGDDARGARTHAVSVPRRGGDALEKVMYLSWSTRRARGRTRPRSSTVGLPPSCWLSVRTG